MFQVGRCHQDFHALTQSSLKLATLDVTLLDLNARDLCNVSI